MSASRDSNGRERGFALLALLAVIGAGSMLLVVAVQRLVPPQGQHQRIAAGNLATCVAAAELSFHRNGAFPTSFDLLATAAGLDPTGPWRRDPFGAAQDFVWSRNGTRLQLRSRGLTGAPTPPTTCSRRCPPNAGCGCGNVVASACSGPC